MCPLPGAPGQLWWESSTRDHTRLHTSRQGMGSLLRLGWGRTCVLKPEVIGSTPFFAGCWPEAALAWLEEASSGWGHLLLESQQGREPSLTSFSAVPCDCGSGTHPPMDLIGET